MWRCAERHIFRCFLCRTLREAQPDQVQCHAWQIPKGPAHARLGGRPKSGIGPSFEPPDQSDEPRRVPEFQAADQMTDFNDTNSIMRGNMSVQSDPNRQLAARNAASMAMRSSFSDAGEDRVDRDTQGWCRLQIGCGDGDPMDMSTQSPSRLLPGRAYSRIPISEKCNPLFAAFSQEVPTHRVRAGRVPVQMTLQGRWFAACSGSIHIFAWTDLTLYWGFIPLLHVCCPSKPLTRGLHPADRRMARNQEQQKAARDEYLLNLFRRADQNCTHQVEPAQQDAWGGQGPGMTGRSPQQLVGQAPARPSSNLPGYLAHGPLPVHGNPSSAGSQEPHKVDAAGSGAIQSMLPSAGSVLNPAKVWQLPCATTFLHVL